MTKPLQQDLVDLLCQAPYHQIQTRCNISVCQKRAIFLFPLSILECLQLALEIQTKDVPLILMVVFPLRRELAHLGTSHKRQVFIDGQVSFFNVWP